MKSFVVFSTIFSLVSAIICYVSGQYEWAALQGFFCLLDLWVLSDMERVEAQKKINKQ